jgi:hypothetical protein
MLSWCLPQWNIGLILLCQLEHIRDGSERRLSSEAYRNQVSECFRDTLGLDTSLRSYSTGAADSIHTQFSAK